MPSVPKPYIKLEFSFLNGLYENIAIDSTKKADFSVGFFNVHFIET